MARRVEPASRGYVRGRWTLTFIDTNILVYSAALSSPLRLRAQAALRQLAGKEQRSLSRQVLREYLAVMTRQQLWGRPLTLSEAAADTDRFLRSFTVLEDGPAVWQKLGELGRRFSFGGRQVHDANIVATMLAHSERHLLTFNEADFRRYARVIDIILP